VLGTARKTGIDSFTTWLNFPIMGTVQLRREIKRAIDRLPAERLSSLADYVHFLTRPSLEQRLTASEKKQSRPAKA
jgi:hypothetical protein